MVSRTDFKRIDRFVFSQQTNFLEQQVFFVVEILFFGLKVFAVLARQLREVAVVDVDIPFRVGPFEFNCECCYDQKNSKGWEEMKGNEIADF